MKIYVRELKSYSLHMNVSLTVAHFMHWCVKAHLIRYEWPDQDIVKMYDSYFKRIWGNHEIQVYSKESFEKAWLLKIDVDVAGK